MDLIDAVRVLENLADGSIQKGLISGRKEARLLCDAIDTVTTAVHDLCRLEKVLQERNQQPATDGERLP
jgi:hypothetical protein